MNDFLATLLTAQLDARHPNLPYVFWNPKTQDRWAGRAKLMESLCRRAGVKPFGFHALRHFGASMLADDGTPVPKISKLLGHTSTQVTDRYIQVLDESLREPMERLGEATRLMGLPSEKSHQSPITAESGVRAGSRKVSKMAERVGFEPTVPVKVHTRSRRAP